MGSSGTYSWELNNADIISEAFARIEIRPPEITGPHMVEARRSLNLELQRWSNADVPMLWKMELVSITLLQGVSTYSIPSNVSCILDTYVRLFTLNNTFNVAVDFSVSSAQTQVSIVVQNHGLVTGEFVNISTPVSVANLLLQGYYQVSSVIDANTFTITSPAAATSTVNNGGTIPNFTAVVGQPSITVMLSNHGMTINSLFNVAAPTIVGGVTLSGSYTVTGVSSSSVFIISISQDATSSGSQYENYGQLQIITQSNTVDPIDYIMTPLGRTDYADIPNKEVQGRPTSYWYNRQINSTISLWQVPDQNGPYQLNMWCMLRVQDANPTMGETPDVPYNAQDALCGKLACRLAMKYAKPMLEIIKPDADQAWMDFVDENRERADLYILPDFSSYYR